MEYIIDTKLFPQRKLFFLCGPYFHEKDPEDRRVILGNAIRSHGANSVIPLIIDDFFNEGVEKRFDIDLRIFEEICAGISDYTYIFLDTLSSATELGLFSNSNCKNGVRVLIPAVSDIVNKANVGVFIRSGLLDRDDNDIVVLEYRPKVRQAALSSRFISEYYYFVNDSVPDSIQQQLKRDIGYSNSKDYISFSENSGVPKDYSIISYSIEDTGISYKLCSKLLFYLIISYLYTVADNKIEVFSPKILDSDIGEIENGVKKALYNTSLSEKVICQAYDINSISIISEVNISLERFIHYSVVLFNLISLKGRANNGVRLLTQGFKLINYKRFYPQITPGIIFNASQNEYTLAKKIHNNPESYFEEFVLKVHGKNRSFTKYRNNEKGVEARKLHDGFKESLLRWYKHNEASYAYHRGCSIKDCILKHVNGKTFIKLDIRSFFDSIKMDIFEAQVVKVFGIGKRYKRDLDDLIGCCFVNGRLPLGFTISPLFSDIFLSEFDIRILEYGRKNNLTYTRYADDILISSNNEMDKSERKEVILFLESLLYEYGLKLNTQKCVECVLKKQGDFIRYLGISIIRKNQNNYISVGRSFIFKIAKSYLLYNKMRSNEGAINDASLFYMRMRLIGQIDFLRYIEGEVGLNRLNSRVKKYFPEGVNWESI